MPSPSARPEGRTRAVLRAGAVTTLLTFGCTTVRAPVSGIDPTVPVHGRTAEPQVELWLESGGHVTPAESARAVAEAQGALRQALEDRALGDDDVLVVRAQAVSRTRSHRADQHAAMAGLAVGAVALVALAVITSRGHGGGNGRGGGHVGRGGGAARPGRAPFAPGARGTPRAPASGGGGWNVNVDVAVAVPLRDGEPIGPFPAGPPPAAVAPAPPAPARISAVTLPAPAPLSPAHRGFFDGDWVRLELVVVDAWTGAVR